MNIENIANGVTPYKTTVRAPQPIYTVARAPTRKVLFSEQFLEKPVISEKYEMAISPTACTWRGIPTIDDF